MGLRQLQLSALDHGVGHVGGGAWLDDVSLWPTAPDTGALMRPLLSVTPRFLSTPFIAEHMALTVFVAVQPTPDGFEQVALKHLTVHQQTDLAGLRAGYSRVIVHRKAASELMPEALQDGIARHYLRLEDFSQADLAAELEDQDNGAGISKVLGRPCWLQDPIYESPRYFFLAQIQEADLRAASPQYAGLFGNGTGYLFVDNRAKKLTDTAEAGYFFVQST
ncbi:hypothetical protein CKY51_12310 [Xanthomonas maliensis]|nr:hypothetical protein CKY51_12310 [Xanthomonas maliensis]